MQKASIYGQDMAQLQTTVQPTTLRGPNITQNTNSYMTAITQLSNSYTMGCPPVRGDNPRASASGLSYVQVDKHGITTLYHLHQCRPCTSRLHAKVGKDGIK